MDRKKLVLLLGALIIAVGTAFAARSMFAEAAAPEAVAAPEPEGPKVLVAQRALPAGTIITADSLGFQQWPEELMQDAYFIDGATDMSELLGTVVRHPITAGEPVTQGALVKPGERGFLAAALGPGMRAVTVPVNDRTGVGGFVFPGDRVDLLLTQKLVHKESDAEIEGAETILRNLRVLATDQSTVETKNDAGQVQVKVSKTVTLEVTPKLAEQIAVAQTMGTLSLVLRPLADSQAELERAIASGDVNIPEGATPEEEEQILRAAMERPIDGKQTYQTTFDVSKFRVQQERKAEAERMRRLAAAAQAKAGLSPLAMGPTVTVTRGKNVSQVPVGGQRAAAEAVLRSQADGVGEAGQTVPVAGSTVIR